jgi:hypothetical protein
LRLQRRPEKLDPIMHRVAEDGLEESANGSVATGQMRRSSVMATTLALTKHAFSWKTVVRRSYEAKLAKNLRQRGVVAAQLRRPLLTPMPLTATVAVTVAGKVTRRSDKHRQDELFQGEKLSLRQPYAVPYSSVHDR